MSDSAPTPDDLVVSAVLDGLASPDEAERVASDPRLAARLAAFRAVAGAVGGPVPLVDTTVREAHLARAMQAFEESRVTPPVAAVPPPPPGAPPSASAPVDLAVARARHQRPRSTTILSIAAGLILVVAAGAFLVRLSDSTGTGGDDSAASSSESRESSADDSGAAAGGDDSAFTPEAGEASPESEGATTATTTANDGAPSSAADAGVDSSLPSLGTFTKGEDLATRVRGELVLDPRPTDLATDEACADDFGADVTLLGRATVDGAEGLVYVETATGSGRRLWLVDPGTIGADDACRQVIPVQTL